MIALRLIYLTCATQCQQTCCVFLCSSFVIDSKALICVGVTVVAKFVDFFVCLFMFYPVYVRIFLTELFLQHVTFSSNIVPET
uniref:Secreted protein n=1 Tax=Anopheles darlingi TaxID=43151 RepID=A0A2M4D797_ANODA